jgi:plastocyanin
MKQMQMIILLSITHTRRHSMRKTLYFSLAVILTMAAVMMILPPAASAYEVGAVDNGGTITGKVIFTGESVPTRTVVPTKNKDVCGTIRKEPLVEVGRDNGVKNAVAIIKEISRGKPWGEVSEPYKIDNDKCMFHPHVQIVPIGADFVILNSDPFLHNTHSFYNDKTVFNVALPFKGAQVKRKFEKPGVVRVDCDVHGWMRGWVYVADNPYYALTGEDGTFSINEVPPGEYTLIIWQEHSGETEKQVAVKAGETIDIGRIEIK